MAFSLVAVATYFDRYKVAGCCCTRSSVVHTDADGQLYSAAAAAAATLGAAAVTRLMMNAQPRTVTA